MASTIERSHHENKFDRQMRLWGQHGQKALESSHVLVLGAGAIGTETLKNLVLPNVSSFTIVDNEVVSEAECGRNFFVSLEHIGQSRATVVSSLLCEMNPSCKGTAIVRDPEELIQRDIAFFDSFDLVVATQMSDQHVLQLSDRLYNRSIPFIYAKAFGLLGYLRVCVQEHSVADSHSESDRTDLYIYPEQIRRFPILENFLNSFDLSDVDPHKHAHVPYPAILYQLSKKWLQTHDSLPKGRDIQEFKALIRSKSLDINLEENYSEALRFCHYAIRDPLLRVDPDVKALLEHEKAKQITSSSSPFWIVVAALNRFIQKEGKGFLPVSGSIPDMTADTDSYVSLKSIYAAQAQLDVEIVKKHVNKIVEDSAVPSSSVPSAEYIEDVVKNVRFLQCASTHSLASEYRKEQHVIDALQECVSDEADNAGEGGNEMVSGPVCSAVTWYVAIRASETFRNEFGRYPGDGTTVEDDVQHLMQHSRLQATALSLEASYADDSAVRELVRFGSSEVHTTAAVLGGIVAQAALKLLTRQFVPINNTVIWNGSLAILSHLSL